MTDTQLQAEMQATIDEMRLLLQRVPEQHASTKSWRIWASQWIPRIERWREELPVD